MRVRRRTRIIVAVSALAMSVLTSGSSGTESSKLAGIYELVKINGESLPAPSGVGSKKETLSGILLFSSDGKWAALMTEQEILNHSGGSKTTFSGLLIGRYELNGDTIKLHDDTLDDTYTGFIKEKYITVESVEEGQKDKYLFRRKKL